MARLEEVDLQIVNGGEAQPNEYSMRMTVREAVNLMTGQRKPLADFKAVPCHAVAGIGYPERFFKAMERAGVTCIPHDFPDHFAFQPQDVEFDDALPVLMTEKDAVKCQKFANEKLWAVPVQADVDPAFTVRLIELLSEKHDR